MKRFRLPRQSPDGTPNPRIDGWASARSRCKARSQPRAREAGDQTELTVLGRPLPALSTKDGLRATIRSEQTKPESIRSYLEKRSGEVLPEVESAMQTLARAYSRAGPENHAYWLYESFRSEIQEGKRG